MGKRQITPEERNRKQSKRKLIKQRTAFMANIAKLSAMKLTEGGWPTTATTGYAEIARRIREIRKDISGGVRDVMAAFVEQKEEAKRLTALVAEQARRKKEVRSSFKSYVAFYDSEEWRRLRYQVLRRDGGRCALCGATSKDGVRLHVDHIKPRSLFRELELDPNNLQVLCEGCNLGKGNTDEIDWRANGVRRVLPAVSEESGPQGCPEGMGRTLKQGSGYGARGSS